MLSFSIIEEGKAIWSIEKHTETKLYKQYTEKKNELYREKKEEMHLHWNLYPR